LPVVCLAHAGDVLYACSNDRGGFALGASRDGGVSFEPRLILSDVRGPLACAEGTSVSASSADWPATSERLGIRPAPVSGGVLAGELSGEAGGGCSVAAPGTPGPGTRHAMPTLLAALLCTLSLARRRARGLFVYAHPSTRPGLKTAVSK